MPDSSHALVPGQQRPWWIQMARQIGQAAHWLHRRSKETIEKIHPDLREQIKELPIIAMTQLAPRSMPELVLRESSKNTVILVHGYGGSRGNFLPMQSYFRLRGYTNTFSVGFHDTSRIETMADELKSALKSLVLRNQMSPNSIDIVGHSLGGIISRVMLEDPDLQPYIRNLVTLATPHSGSGLARYLDTPICRGLLPGSSLLSRLEAQRWNHKGMPKLTAFWTPKDCILIPAVSAKLDGVKNVCEPECTHLTFLLKPGVWDRIIDALEENQISQGEA